MNKNSELTLPPNWKKIKPVAPGVVDVPLIIVNAYLVGTSSSWVLIDAGLPFSAKAIKRAAETCFGENAKPKAIILTHGHFDHVGALKDLIKDWNVPVYAHKLELPYLNGSSSYPPVDATVGGGGMTQLSRIFPTKPLKLGRRLRALPETGELKEMPGWTIIHTPGHSPGHVSFFREQDKVLIAGDAFVTTKQESLISSIKRPMEINRPPAYFTQDWNAAESSVKKLADLNPLIVATGHGLPMSGPAMLEDLKKLSDNFKNTIPKKGRYVKEAARFDENGVTYIPKAVPDRLPTLIGLFSAGIITGITAYKILKKRNP